MASKKAPPLNWGCILCHGSRAPDSSFVVLPPKSCPFLLIADTNKTTTTLEADLELICDMDGRNCCEAIYNKKPYRAGAVIPNVVLYFRVTFDNETRYYTTGIVTYGKMTYREQSNLFSNDHDLMVSSMSSHDNSIIQQSELWGKRIPFGNIVSLVTSKYPNFGFVGAFCRVSRCDEELPAFLTYKITEETYFESFLDKVSVLENCVSANTYTGYSIVTAQTTSFRLQVTLSKICCDIRIKLSNDNNTISAYDFYAVIEIFHTKRIPLECVETIISSKIKIIYDTLMKLNEQSIIVSNSVKQHKLFLDGLRDFLCVVIKKNFTASYLVKHADTFDKMIIVAEAIATKVPICDNDYEKVLRNLLLTKFLA